jgi:hypothetical protein
MAALSQSVFFFQRALRTGCKWIWPSWSAFSFQPSLSAFSLQPSAFALFPASARPPAAFNLSSFCFRSHNRTDSSLRSQS